LRAQCIQFFADYQACIRIVYVEIPEERLMRQNHQREVPDPTEAQGIEWEIK
jgi:hypothetical protein